MARLRSAQALEALVSDQAEGASTRRSHQHFVCGSHNVLMSAARARMLTDAADQQHEGRDSLLPVHEGESAAVVGLDEERADEVCVSGWAICRRTSVVK